MRNLSSLAICKNKPLKLHLGCGGVRYKDFINIDLYPETQNEIDSSRNGCVADYYGDMRCLSLPSNSVDEIFTSHTIDHFTRWVAIEMLADWHRMLKPNGKLVIEAADFWRCVIWLFNPFAKKRSLARSQFYGNQWDKIDYETHRYLWSSKELKGVLFELGFATVVHTHKTETHYPGRDMRIVATK